MWQSRHRGMPKGNGKGRVNAGGRRAEENRSSASLQGGDPRSHEVEKSAIRETHAKPLGICREVTLAVKAVETIPCHEWLYSWYVAIQTDDHLRSEPALPQKGGQTQIVLLV